MNMKRVQKIILNPSFFAAGQALQADSDVLIIGRNSSIGDEWTYSFRQIKESDIEPSTEITSCLQKQMFDLEIENKAIAFSVLLYEALEKYTDKFLLWTELESVREVDDGFELSVYTVSGHELIHCRELIDTSTEALTIPDWGQNNIESKTLNMLIDKQNDTSSQIQELGGLKVRAGRNETEHIIEYSVHPEVSLSVARTELLNIWHKRPENLKNWKIASFGSEFDYSLKCNKHIIKPNFLFINPLAFDSPIAALEAGLTGGVC